MTFAEQLWITVVDKAIIGIILAFVAIFANRALEKFKADRAIDLETFKSTSLAQQEGARGARAALAEVARLLASASHSICWITWAARFAPRTVSDEAFANYDREMHDHFSRIVAARVVLAALDNEAHERVDALARKVFELDEAVSVERCRFGTDAEEALRNLGDIHPQITSFDDKLLTEIAAASTIVARKTAVEGRPETPPARRESSGTGQRANAKAS